MIELELKLNFAAVWLIGLAKSSCSMRGGCKTKVHPASGERAVVEEHSDVFYVVN